MLNNHELTDEETKTLKKKASEILSVCRRDILTKYPFIGSIALRMEMVPVRDVRVRTACTDGNAVYFDIAFLSSLTREEQTFVLAHEVWHAVMMHLVRRQNRIPSLFNVATDKEVNYMLKQDGFTPPAELLFPTKDEEGKCAEEIYEMLLKKMPKQSMAGSSGNGSSSNSQSGSNSQSNSNKSKNSKNSSSSSSSGKKKDGNETGDFSGQFDKHIYDGMEDNQNQPNKNRGKNGDDSADQDGNGSDAGNESDGNEGFGYAQITDKYGKVGFDSDYQPKVSKDFTDKMRETIVSEAQRCEKMKGNLPAHIKELVKKCMTPEIKWQEVLAQFVTRCYNSGNKSWIPPNRRHIHNGIYLQSRQASKIKLALIIDTSGSTIGDRGIFLTELNSLIKSFGLFDLTILDVDAEVNDVRHYTQDDNLEWEIENGNFTMSGGGGTSMLPGLKRIIEDQIECDAIICLTDGYIDHIPTNPTGLPMLWIITKDGTEDFCNWGQKIKLKGTDSDFE